MYFLQILLAYSTLIYIASTVNDELPFKPNLLRSVSTPMILNTEGNGQETINMEESDIIVFRINSQDTVLLWNGYVHYKQGYQSPKLGDNIIDYWKSYQLFDTITAYQLSKTIRKPQKLTIELNNQHYIFFFTPNSQNEEDLMSGYVMNVDYIYEALADTQKKYEDSQMIHNALTSHQTRYQCYNILMCLQSIQETVPILKKTRATDVIDEEGKVLTHNEICDAIVKDSAKAQQFTSILLKRQQQCEDVIACQHATMKLDLKSFDLVNLVKGLWKDLYSEAKRKDIKFCLQIEALSNNQLPFVKQDEFRFKQICTTLIGNAIQFTPESGTIRLYLGLDQEYIDFSVTDSGSGIDENVLLSHQQKMKLGKLSFSQPKPSAGLGYSLAITQHIIHLMQGTIQIFTGNTEGSTLDGSNNGEMPEHKDIPFYDFSIGTQILVKIPYQYDAIESFYSENPESMQLKPSIPMTSTRQSRFRIPKRDTIVVVDDDPIIHKIWGKILAKLGHVFHMISDGEEAVRYYETHHTSVSLIIMDIQMPHNGIEATRNIRTLENKIDLPCRINIVANTASGSSDIFRRQCHEAGMNSFLQKPNTKSDVSQIIEQYAIFN